MIIEKLIVRGFRNLEERQFDFIPGKNLLFGENGAGKTSVLEAIFLLGFGKSFMNVKKAEILNFNRHAFNLELEVQNGDSNHTLVARYDSGQFFLYLDEQKSNLIEINQYLYPVLFSSANYNISIESRPAMRRVVDRFIFGVRSLYIHYILSYNRALKQKNHLLKTSRNYRELCSWNKILSEMSEKIMSARFEFLVDLNQEISNKFGNDFVCDYRPSLALEKSPSFEEIYSHFERISHDEIDYGRALIGPHLDRFELNLKGKNLRLFSSGERKVHLLMVYIAFLELYNKMKGEYPVFLVDDFDTAMDESNVQFLIESYPDLQVIATSVTKYSLFEGLFGLKKEC